MALALRGPTDEDSESDANDARAFAEGSDGSHPMNPGLEQAMALQGQSGGDASAAGESMLRLSQCMCDAGVFGRRTDMRVQLVSPHLHCILFTSAPHVAPLHGSREVRVRRLLQVLLPQRLPEGTQETEAPSGYLMMKHVNSVYPTVDARLKLTQAPDAAARDACWRQVRDHASHLANSP